MLTYEQAHELFRYDRRTGKLYYRVSLNSRARQGAEVGSLFTRRKGKGFYRQCQIFREHYFVHRVIWLMIYGRWPRHELDHEDHDGLNNRRGNLKDASRRSNSMNVPLRSNNSSGCNGVFKHAGKWRVQIGGADTNRYKGTFSSKCDAVRVALLEQKKLGFHLNHGAAA